MRILVTGAIGFIGKHLCEELLRLGHYVVGVDDLSGGTQNLVWAMQTIPKGSFEFHELDLVDYRRTEDLILDIKPEIVFHCAATAREGASHFDPANMVNRNIVTYANTIENCIKAGTLKRFVLFSSMAVYGKQKPPFSENMWKKPVDVYAQCKAFMEDSIEDLAETHNFEYVIIRPHNIYGPAQSMSDKYRNVVMIWINSLLRGEKINIYGDGTHRRAFSYIGDCITPFVKCGFQDGLNGEIINIGGSTEYTLNELCDTILDEYFQDDTPKIRERYVVYLPDRFREVSDAWCTTTKSHELLGFKDTFSLREGIKRTIAWARKEGSQEWTTYKLPLQNSKCPKNWLI